MKPFIASILFLLSSCAAFGQCVGHAPLIIAPKTVADQGRVVLVKWNVHFTYALANPNELAATRFYLMSALWGMDPGKYQEASTVPAAPYLTLTVDISSTNGQAPYTAVLTMATADGGFLRDTFSQEQTAIETENAIVYRVHTYAILGWSCGKK